MKPEAKSAQVTLRSPDVVMRLSRLGSFHQSRLSFMRILLRRARREGWRFSRPKFEIDASGIGHAIYQVDTGNNIYSLVAFAHDLPDNQRSDRVIAEAWDATFTLFDGVPSDTDIHRLAANVPLQEAGRISKHELSLSRANRSVRLWTHVVDRLTQGQQPDPKLVRNVGYLMRTTAVYGSGKFGAADYDSICDRAEFTAPFQVEMLTVYLIRAFVRDLVEAAAKARNPDAARLDHAIARSLGIGNSTGLGMAPYLINHPMLLNNWITAREIALARVQSVRQAARPEIDRFRNVLMRARQSVSDWTSDHPLQRAKLEKLNADLDRLIAHVDAADLSAPDPWRTLFQWSERTLGEDAQEWLASLLLEPYGTLVDDLADDLSDRSDQQVDGTMSVESLRSQLEDTYGWALPIDFRTREASARLWYISEEKLEPRLGERYEEPIQAYEEPLAPGSDAAALFGLLRHWRGDARVAELLLLHPEYRSTVKRAQQSAAAPYAEIRENTISEKLLPIDMLRCKLSFFGATHFDPRSDRWVRICLFGNAPYPEELAQEPDDDWPYPAQT